MQNYQISFPEVSGLSQGEEYFYATISGKRQKIQLHDYQSIYQHPFLYEAVLCDVLKYGTPQEIIKALEQVVEGENISPQDMNVLEIGAGSGVFGEHLANFGVGKLTGLDIEPLAKEAAFRDRPGLYHDYFVLDLINLTSVQSERLLERQFNCVAVAAATGWGNHIPVAGFQAAFDHLMPNGLFVYHVKRDKDDAECVELSRWVDNLMNEKVLDCKFHDSCFHRQTIDGQNIYYDVIIGIKRSKLSS
jgi:SAM-dependent methyltransferase